MCKNLETFIIWEHVFFLSQVTEKELQRTEFYTEFHVSYSGDNIQEKAKGVY